jgi:tyrosine-protein phosphatase YwqE
MERCPGINNSYEHLKKKNNSMLENIIKNSELLLNNEEIKSTAIKIKEKKGIFNLFKK